MVSERKNSFPIQIPAGKCAYFLDVRGSAEGNRTLLIGETRQARKGFDEHRILIHEAYIEAFLEAVEQIAAVFNEDPGPAYDEGAQQAEAELEDGGNATAGDKAYDLEEIRKEHPRAYEKWSEDEDDQLYALHATGETIANLAEHFQRKPGAIKSRLKKLGLDRPRYD